MTPTAIDCCQLLQTMMPSMYQRVELVTPLSRYHGGMYMADYEDDDLSDTYNLDSDIVDLQANVHKQHPKNPTFNRIKHCQNHALHQRTAYLKLHIFII